MASDSIVPPPIPPSPTKVVYVDGRATSITLRRCQLERTTGGTVQRKVFERDTVTLGSAGENDMIVDDETVSRNHCRIFMEDGHYMVKDLDSTNGTFVNRVRIREAWLKPGCTLHLGRAELRFTPVEQKVEVVPSTKQQLGEIIGRNAKVREVYTIIEKIAPTDATIVI